MVIQHNLTAMNASRMLGVTTGQQAKQSEKLASGYKINRAGDDAAGLKISEKMRSQIRGLQKASTNAQDGVSLIQTAEGALNEAHSILQRMNELTVQGANDTNEGIDRQAINEELTALTAELNRIASTTQFNKQNLLDGNYVNKKLQVGANTNQKISVTITAMDATAIGLNTSATVLYDKTKYTYSGTSYATLASAKTQYETTKATITKSAIQSATSAGGVSGYYIGGTGTKYTTLKSAQDKVASNYDARVTALGTIGSVDYQTSATVTAPTVSDYEKAQATLSKIQIAINNVSSQRSALGALQNRLEHTIANLDNVAENTQAAESRIRDTDMAAEMVDYSKNQILAQAGQSMLAQANQATQGVLSLLQ